MRCCVIPADTDCNRLPQPCSSCRACEAAFEDAVLTKSFLAARTGRSLAVLGSCYRHRGCVRGTCPMRCCVIPTDTDLYSPRCNPVAAAEPARLRLRTQSSPRHFWQSKPDAASRCSAAATGIEAAFEALARCDAALFLLTQTVTASLQPCSSCRACETAFEDAVLTKSFLAARTGRSLAVLGSCYRHRGCV
ncbi:hypothetical protein PS645_00714 [Pseudomonas fluorescens]|uniref:Uncharacterized protein n=1 Tax=Pseudomonas fluorescens TaxID=294 RepID=A0A5E6Q391_PSEFL|nr:hypothetical protein PS645_00714 [Pseudomonas fluorescens]